MAGHIYLPGTVGVYIYSVDIAAYSVLADFELQAEVAPTSWKYGASICLIAHHGGGGARGPALFVDATGHPYLWWSEDGSAISSATATAAVSYADNQRGWLGASMDADNGAGGYDVKFWTSSDGITWTQLGNTVTGGSTTSQAAITQVLEMGSRGSGGSNVWEGNVYHGRLYDGDRATGTLEYDADFTDLTAGEIAAKSFVEDSVNANDVKFWGSGWSYVEDPDIGGGILLPYYYAQ